MKGVLFVLLGLALLAGVVGTNPTVVKGTPFYPAALKLNAIVAEKLSTKGAGVDVPNTIASASQGAATIVRGTKPLAAALQEVALMPGFWGIVLILGAVFFRGSLSKALAGTPEKLRDNAALVVGALAVAGVGYVTFGRGDVDLRKVALGVAIILILALLTQRGMGGLIGWFQNFAGGLLGWVITGGLVVAGLLIGNGSLGLNIVQRYLLLNPQATSWIFNVALAAEKTGNSLGTGEATALFGAALVGLAVYFLKPKPKNGGH